MRAMRFWRSSSRSGVEAAVIRRAYRNTFVSVRTVQDAGPPPRVGTSAPSGPATAADASPVSTGACMTRIGIVAEQPGENRVAATPLTVGKLRGLGYEVVVERGAGEASVFPDSAFEEAGATIVDRATAWAAPIVLKV